MRWLIEHAVDIMNKYSINRTGLSPYEELHGQKAKERRLEFGERVFYSTPKKGRAKMDMRWKLGVYLGHAHASNELFIGIPNGNILKARSAVRVIEESRWSKDAIQKIIGSPDDMHPVDDNNPTADEVESSERPHDFDVPEVDPDAQAADIGEDHEVPNGAGFRRIRITRRDLDKYGTTPGCPRCAGLWEAQVQEGAQ